MLKASSPSVSDKYRCTERESRWRERATGDSERCGRYGDSLWRQPCSISSSGREPRGTRSTLDRIWPQPPPHCRRRPSRRPSKIRHRSWRRRSARLTSSCCGWFAPGRAWVHRRCGHFHACPGRPAPRRRSSSFIQCRRCVRSSLIASLGNFRSAYVRFTYVRKLRLSARGCCANTTLRRNKTAAEADTTEH